MSVDAVTAGVWQLSRSLMDGGLHSIQVDETATRVYRPTTAGWDLDLHA